MNRFERYLTLWVALCMGLGILAGHIWPVPFATLGGIEVAHVNVPVAVLIWLMVVPMLLRVDFRALGQVRRQWKGVVVTLFVNWAVKPFSMAFLGWLFLRHVFADALPVGQTDGYIAGLILLAAAPCTAMVFVWSNLCNGEPAFTLSQVAINDTIMVVAFAPLVALLLGVSAITVPWATLTASVVLYIVLPVVGCALARTVILRRGGEGALMRLLKVLSPMSMAALLLMLTLLFGFQGQRIIDQPVVIAILAVPILIQVYFNAGLAYMLSKWLRVPHCIAGPAALIGASNFFELAVATAVGLFGIHSGAALATVVGVLVEVPVMLSVVALVNRSRRWYAAGWDAKACSGPNVARETTL